MAKLDRYVVKIVRVIGQRSVLQKDQVDDVLETEVLAMSIKGAITRTMKDKPEWFDTPLGEINLTVFRTGS